MVGSGFGVCGEEVGRGLLWGFPRAVCSDHGECCSVMARTVRIQREASAGLWHGI